MKKLMIAIAFLSFLALPVQARTDRVCTTDSYGNTTCTESTTNVRTGEIAYSDGVHSVEILNTSTPSFVSIIAFGTVSLGAISLYLKKKLQ